MGWCERFWTSEAIIRFYIHSTYIYIYICIYMYIYIYISLEKEMATHSSILAWKIPWTEDPGRLQSMGCQRVEHDWATSLHFTSYSTYPGGTHVWCILITDLTIEKKNNIKVSVKKFRLILQSCIELLWPISQHAGCLISPRGCYIPWFLFKIYWSLHLPDTLMSLAKLVNSQ